MTEQVLSVFVKHLAQYNNVSASTFITLLSTLAAACRGSPAVVQHVYDMGICECLEGILSGDFKKNDQEKKLSQETLSEMVQLVFELVPRAPIDTFAVDLQKKKDALQRLVVSKSTPSTPTTPSTPSTPSRLFSVTKQAFFEKNPQYMLKFGEHLLHQVMHLYSSTVLHSIRHKCLLMIGSIMYYANGTTMKEMLVHIPFSTFVTSVLSSNDMVDVATAVQIAEVCIKKLPDIFNMYFVREGVVNQIIKISGRATNDESPLMIEQMKVAVKDAMTKYQLELAEFQQKEKERIAEVKRKKEEKAKAKLEAEQAKAAEQKTDEEKPSEDEEEAKQEEEEEEEKPKKAPSAPVVQLPTIPVNSRFSDKNCDKTMLLNRELVEYAVAIAQLVHTNYFANDVATSKFASPVVSKLHNLSNDLMQLVDMPDPEDEIEALVKIRDLLVSEEGVSNYELMNSKVFKGILHYLTAASNSTKAVQQRMERIDRFCACFDKVIEHEQRSRSSSPLSSPLSNSPHRKALQQRPQRYTYYLELCKKVQGCFASLENFPLLVSESLNPMSSVRNAIQMLSKNLKINCEAHNDSSKLYKLNMSPLITVGNLADFLAKKLETDAAAAAAKQTTEQAQPMETDDEEERQEESIQKAEEYTETDEEENEEMAQASVVQSTLPENSTDKYAFLNQEDKQQAKQSTSSPKQVVLMIDDAELDPSLNIVKAIIQHTESSSKHPYHSSVWDDVSKLKYKETSATTSSYTTTTAANSAVQFDQETERQLTFVKFLENTITNSFKDVDPDAVILLELLRLLFVFSTNAKSLPHVLHATQPYDRLVQTKEFQSTKLAAKLERQLHDPYVLFTSCLPSWCYDLVTQCPFLFNFQTRQDFFQYAGLGIARAIKKMQDEQTSDPRFKSERMIRIEKKKFRIKRSIVLEHAYQVLQEHGSNRAVFEFEFEDEVGTGQGPTLEFYTLVSREVQQSALKIWKDEQDKIESATQVVKHATGLYPRIVPSSVSIAREEKLFKFIGAFVARSLYDKRVIDMPFSNAFLKAIRGDELSFRDLIFVDRDLYKQLDKLKILCAKRMAIKNNTQLSKQEQEQKIEELLLDDKCRIVDLGLDFTFPGQANIELVPNGAQIEVTIHNLHDYVTAVTNMALAEGIQRQVQAFKTGFSQLIPTKMLKLFTLQELDELVCGTDEPWTEQLLLEHTKCDHGYTHHSKTVKLLFQVLVELNKDQKQNFLKFVTGCPKLPVGGMANLKPKLTIVQKVTGDESPDSYLPSVMTCTHYLKLPPYSSASILKLQLLKAMEEGEAFLLS